MNLTIQGEDLKILLLVVPLLIAQSIYLFLDARKRGRNAWLWGLWGIIQCPMPILFYMMCVRRIRFNRRDNR
ncbi:hypothetical protein [Marinicrinis lubricantis]|uniref:SigmaY antisigma factor component n=1 Tax=Marinicrinis lubricantis TaxID=2086470 RepID=A0ABW1ITS5_9BACL